MSNKIKKSAKISKENKLLCFLKELLFPSFCFQCLKEGCYLCSDCQETLEVSGFHKKFNSKNLDDLYFATDYKNKLIKKIIRTFKYQPLAKELKKPLCQLIIKHFGLIDNNPNFSDFIIIPIPLFKKKLKWRGFNQAELLAEELSLFFKIPLSNDLLKIKETRPQAELGLEKRKENIKNAFLTNSSLKEKKIILVDDIYTSGKTIEEAARILKKAGAKRVIGIVVARG